MWGGARTTARYAEELAAKGGTGRIVVLPDSVHTAALAAEALGCEVGAIANSLLFDADGSPVLILTSGAHRVDTGKVAAELGAKGVLSASDIVKVSLVGVGMRSHAGVAQKMFSALAAEGINIKVITTSEIKISVLIDTSFTELAVRTLHSVYGLDR